jgi:hypothetical protein
MAGQVLPHRAGRDAALTGTDERQRKMVYSKQETTGVPTCCHVTR